ncbi:MAG: ribosomal RNA small subunit methyltransferase A [Anaerolineae bacterium]|nr:ribosomal RNA small subunit methyltransferase A [Anaerolineae bacterium]
MKFAETQPLSTLLKKYNLRPRKGLGQNFLADPFHLAQIVATAELDPEDVVLEIGPGPGTLTRLLAEAAGRVIAIELDPNMVNLLQNELGYLPNLTVIQADILQTNLKALITNFSPTFSSFKVVANLPYYITSAVMRHLLETTPRPQRIVVTVQKEVARRIVAKPGNMSLLALSVQFYGQPKITHHIPAGAFYPPPKVDSAVVRIDSFPQPLLPAADAPHFFRVARAGFGQKRKQLKNALVAGLSRPMLEIIRAMEKAGVDTARRAETLSLTEWERLAETLR